MGSIPRYSVGGLNVLSMQCTYCKGNIGFWRGLSDRQFCSDEHRRRSRSSSSRNLRESLIYGDEELYEVVTSDRSQKQKHAKLQAQIIVMLSTVMIGVLAFAAVSFVGMLPGTFIFVNAGTQLAQITSPSEILSVTVIGSLLALALVPWLAKIIIGWWKFHRTSGRFPRPHTFAYDVVVIGAGSGGLTAANASSTEAENAVWTAETSARAGYETDCPTARTSASKFGVPTVVIVSTGAGAPGPVTVRRIV